MKRRVQWLSPLMGILFAFPVPPSPRRRRPSPRTHSCREHRPCGAGRILVLGDSHSMGHFGRVIHQELREAYSQAKVTLVAACGKGEGGFLAGGYAHCGVLTRKPNGKITRPRVQGESVQRGRWTRLLQGQLPSTQTSNPSSTDQTGSGDRPGRLQLLVQRLHEARVEQCGKKGEAHR